MKLYHYITRLQNKKFVVDYRLFLQHLCFCNSSSMFYTRLKRWIWLASFGLLTSSGLAQKASLNLEVATGNAKSRVYITLTSDRSLLGMQFSLKWNPSRATFDQLITIHPAVNRQIHLNTASAAQGSLSLAWLTDNLVSGYTFRPDDTLLVIEFNLLSTDDPQFRFSNQPTPLEFVDIHGGVVQVLTSDGLSTGALIRGYVFHDNGDCQRGQDPAVANWFVIAVDQSGSDRRYQQVTDTGGYFSMLVPMGNYRVFAFPPNIVWYTCEEDYKITFDTNHQDTFLNIGAQALVDCPDLHLSFSSYRLRRCAENQFKAIYYNFGSAPAENAYISAVLDPGLTMVSASVPYSQSGNIVTFNLGTIPSGAKGEFDAFIKVDCDIPLGVTHCVEATIFPNNVCEEPSSTWSGASLEVRADCERDSAVFVIQNTGQGDMVSPESFVITEDVVAFLKDFVQLPKLTGKRVSIHSTGKTYRLEVDQVPNHPGNRIPRAFVQGCGSLDPASLDIVNQFEEDDRDPYRSILCRQSIDSYPSNELITQPTGVSNAHYILPTTPIEYQIHFQNIGTAPANNIIIYDTLSEHLDYTSIFFGAASHNYRVEFVEQNVVRFSFNHIDLPTKLADEKGSQGFVSFTILPLTDLRDGTVITNRAAIIFDHNQPSLTNQVLHRIQRNYLEITSFTHEKAKAWQKTLKIAPNPFTDHTRLSWAKWTTDHEVIILLFNQQGANVRTYKTTQSELTIYSNDLPPGFYFVTIQIAPGVMAHGKLSVY